MPSKIFILLLLFLLQASCLIRDNGSLPDLLILRELGKKVVGVITGTDNTNTPPTSTPPTTNTPVGNTPTTTPPSAPTISNLRDKGVTYSGFIIGTATQGTLALSSVEVSLDNGSYSQATGTTSWKFQLPTGSSTWRDNTQHTISVRAKDVNGNVSAVTTISARKGQNKDINGDGYSDVVVGGTNNTYIFYSSGSSGVSSTNLAGANATLTGSGGFGWRLAMGDANGDGYADVIVGCDTQSKAFIFHSLGTNGISSTNQASANTTFTGGTQLGINVSFGDVNGDGFSDAIIGDSLSGMAYIFHSLGNSGISNASIGAANTTFTGSNGFGIFVVLGDVNGDGYSDALVGDSGTGSSLFIFHSAGITGINNVSSGSANTSLTRGTCCFGYSIAIGDTNGDGYQDVIVGHNSSNTAYIFHSSGTSGITSTNTAGANTTLTGSGGNFGTSVSSSDINGDGFADVIVGELSNDKAFLFLSGGNSGVASTNDLGANTTFTGSGGAGFSRPLRFGDVNGDGLPDVIIGADTAFKVYIFHNSGYSGIANVNHTNANTTLTGGGGFGYSTAFLDYRKNLFLNRKILLY